MSGIRWGSGITFALLTACCAAVLAASAHAVPATDLRSGVVSFDGNSGLTTVPLFVVPSGSRFVLTDFGWTPGKYPTFVSGAYPGLTFGVWIQDASNNVRWYRGVGGGSSNGGDYNMTPQVSLTSGIVFEPNTVVTVGVSTNMTLSWTATWSGYLESVSVSDAGGAKPEPLALEAFPNPTGAEVLFQFRLAKATPTTLVIYDAKGRRIRSLFDRVEADGWHVAPWDGRDEKGRAVAPGAYFARLATAEDERMEKVVRVK